MHVQAIAPELILAAPAPSGHAPRARPGRLVPALAVAVAIHAALLALLLLAGRSAPLPEVAEPPAVSMVFQPEAPALPEMLTLPSVSPPDAAPVPPDAAPPPSLPSPNGAPAIDLPPPPDVQASEPMPTQAPAPPDAPPRAAAPRLVAPSLRTVQRWPAAPSRLSQTPPAARPAIPAPSAPAQSTPTSPTAQPPSAASSAVSNAAWRDALVAWLQRHKTYPEMARQEGTEGRVMVHFTASRDGRVLDVGLAQSSGSRVLDEAALGLLRGARLPPFPAGTAQETMSATLPITYQLD